MEVQTSLGYVHLGQGIGYGWEVRRGPRRASGDDLARLLRFVGLPIVEAKKIASMVAHPTTQYLLAGGSLAEEALATAVGGSAR